MKIYAKYAAALALLFGVSATASAQVNKDEIYPNTFISVQAGAQTTFTDYNNLKLITPQFALSVGHWFCPQFGVRAHFMGWQNKSAIDTKVDTKYKYKAITGDVDFLLNMSNIISPNRASQRWNWLIIAGWGANVGWGFDEYRSAVAANSNYATNLVPYDYSQSTFNGRLGTAVEYNICNCLAVNLELQANYKNDLYNLKVNDRCDWQAVALLGLTYRFGKKCAKKAPVVAEPVYATRIDTVWYDDTQYKTEQVPEQIERDIHYAICQSDPVDPVKVKEIADFVKTHKDAKVTVTGYADKGTGNAKINMGYSKQRAEAVANALKDAGVPAEIMTVDWKGDTVQPFAENDANRVAITVASGIGEKKTPVVTKKFRTEEVRYQVQ